MVLYIEFFACIERFALQTFIRMYELLNETKHKNPKNEKV